MGIDVTAGSVLAGYRVERMLGRGGMGAVYLAEDVHLHRKVALKVIVRELAGDERFRRRFLLESQLAASLEHPHIVPIYAAGEHEDVLFLAMKYVEGVDLRALVDRPEGVDDARAIAILGQIADALDTAHALGLVHRDVKPANILVAAGAGDQAYLCDFGLARHASTAESLTGEAFVGTVAYVAPEQIEGGPVDARADVYSLGCVVHECLTGVPPFERDGDLKVLFAHLKEAPPLLTRRRPDLPDAVDGVLRKALAKAPDDRFSSCQELVEAFGAALAVGAPAIAPPTRRSIPGIRTFLIADIRGYTSYTAEHGDEAAAALASAFAEVVRQVVEQRDGRLIELRGDEALVVFDSARQALRGATELQERFAAAGLPRGVGIGLDAGEAVRVEGGYRGGALNLAARLCSLAGPGEILASETVAQLAHAVEGIRYGTRRAERVKGLAKPVTAVEVVAAGRETPRLNARRVRRAIARPVRRARVSVVAAAATIAALALVLVVARGGGSGAERVAPQAVGFISPAGKVKGQVPIQGLGDMAVLGNTLWVGNTDQKQVQRIDLRTHRLVQPPVPIQNGVASIATGFGAVWVIDASTFSLLRIDPRYLTIDRIRLPADHSQIDTTAPTEVTTGAGSVWVAEANKVFRVDPQTRRVVKAIDVPQADLLAYGDGQLWVGQSNDSSISQIDPGTNQVTKKVALRGFVAEVVVGGGFVWAAELPDDTLWKIDPAGSVVKTIDVAHDAGGLAFLDGAAWTSAAGRLQRIDAGTDQITEYPVVSRPGPLLAGTGQLFISSDEAPPKLAPLPADRVATLNLDENFIDDTDPGHAFPGPSWRYQLEYATGAQLINYPDAPAPAGLQLKPEVAAAMPTVSDGGRTYTFRVRPGFRFSPPSNEPVTAETFQYSIERALSPKQGQQAPGFGYIADVVGAKAFHEGKADHVTGITVSGDILTIRLVAPAGDFLTRLAAPCFAAVPVDTPISSSGVQTPLPSAGPYYLKTTWHGEMAVLERNPNYHGARPRRLERIVYDIGNDPQRTIDQIETGRADYAADVLRRPQFAAGSPLDARYGPARKVKAPAPRLVQTPQIGSRFLQFNTSRGPLTDPRLRRAVNYAIDRRALAGATHDVPDEAYLPAALRAPGQAAVYPLSPDRSRARALMRGKRARLVLYTCTRPECAAPARIVRANLAPLGLTVRIVRSEDPFAASQRPGARWDIVVNGWYYDWPDHADVLNVFFDTGGYRPNFAPPPQPLPPSFRRAFAQAGPLRGAERAARYQDLAVRLAREAAPLAVYATAVQPELYSARVSCGIDQPTVGALDLGTLCVRTG